MPKGYLIAHVSIFDADAYAAYATAAGDAMKEFNPKVIACVNIAKWRQVFIVQMSSVCRYQSASANVSFGTFPDAVLADSIPALRLSFSR